MVKDSFEDILESITEAFFSLDNNLVFEYFNMAAEDMLGRKREEVLGKYIFDVFPEAKGSIFQKKYQEALREKKEIQFETYFPEKPYENWYNVRVYPKKKNGILVFFHITTKQKNKEEKFINALEESKKLQNKLTALLESSKSILKYKEFEYSAKAIFESCKDLIGAQSGYVALLSEDGSENEILFLNSGGLACNVDPELPMPIRGLREEAYRKADAVYDNDFANSEYIKYMPSGHSPLEKVLFAPLIIDGKAVGLMGIANKESDFTDDDAQTASEFGELAAIALMNSQTLEKLEKSLEEVERSNTELEQFAYVASHDLREPLRMITSFLQLLERRYKDQLDEDANEFIGFAVDGAKRLDAMINDILIYSRVANKERTLTNINLNKTLEEVYFNLKTSIEETNTEITHDQLPTLVLDGQLMIQLFQNLIGNAIKYRSEKTPKIHISAEKEDKNWLFSVKDNGIGISQEHLERIFTIFQRLHSKEEYEGTGIGLAIVQKIVHQHGGYIWVESEQGKGSTFYFTIPII